MNFEQFSFDKRISAQIKAVGFTEPTPIQAQAIPAVLNERDVMGLAQTGTGKTAAFMLPILERLTTGPLRRVRALVVAPTRELAEQIHQTAVDFGKKTKVKSVAVYGGVSKNKQIDKLKKGAEIVVACPGRLLDLASDKAIDLSNVEVLVLDEADMMMDMGFLPDIKRVLKLVPKQRQTLFFSATMPKEIRKLADQILHNPVTVQIGAIAPAETVSHALYPVPHKRKKHLLLALLKQLNTDRILVFTRTKYRAKNLARDLEKKGYKATALQGNMSQNQRQRAMTGFRDGTYDMLVATDIAARGIDISEISHVINFDIPDTVDAYSHRIGRTGRADSSGEAFTFVTEDDYKMIRDIERRLGERIERRQLPDFDYSVPEPTPQQQMQQANGSQPNKKSNRNGRSNRRQRRAPQRG